MGSEQWVVVDTGTGAPFVQARFGVHDDRAVPDRLVADLNSDSGGTYMVLPVSELAGDAQ